jgi:hypothetical protein
MNRRLYTQAALLVALQAAPDVTLATNIAVSGFNQDVVTETGPTPFAHRFDTYTPNPASWIEAGATSYQGSPVPGLPASGLVPSLTGSGVTYQLQPYAGNNVLRMGDDAPASGTLAVIPGQYNQLHILAASGTDGSSGPSELGQTSNITLNFSDGSVTLAGALHAYDWNTNAGGAPASVLAIKGLDRNHIGSGQAASNAVNLDTNSLISIGMSETTLNLVPLGLSGRTLDSITFNDVSPHSATGVFAIDGTVPEPGAVGIFVCGAIALLAKRRGRTL